MRRFTAIVFAVLATFIAGQSVANEKVRLGYWTSGVSLGFGSVLEAKRFLETEGLEVEYVRLPDVTSQIRGIASGSIDITLGSPLSGVYAAANEGVPIRLVAATQLADAVVVVPEGSSIRTLKDLKGKKVGATYPTASVSVILNKVADAGYGLKADEYSFVSGNESRLVQFLAQKQVDAAILRSVTLEQVRGELKLRTVASLVEEWQKTTGNAAPPYIGTAAVTEDFARRHPDAVVRVLRAFIKAEAWGRQHPDEVARILQQQANLPAKDARAFALRWQHMYRTAFDADTLKTLRLEHRIFKEVGAVKGSLDESLFVTQPYQKAVK